MNKIYRKIAFAGLLLAFTACETTELGLTDNPNALPTDVEDANLLINAIQIDFGKFIASVEVEAGETVRILNMDGRNYQNALEPTRFNNEWEEAYQKILNGAKVLTPIAEASGQVHHIAMAQVIEAYVLITLVDMFGDIPFSEALQGEGNANPGVDDGATIYAAAFAMIDDAIAKFGQEVIPTLEPSQDLFYGRNWENWIRAANSLKLKMLVTTRLVDNNAQSEFEAIIASGDFIENSEQDFQFEWGSTFANPDSRHPEYIPNYTPGGANTYMSNWLMGYMQTGKVGNGFDTFEDADPRMKYYFYRQTDVVPQDNPNLINCVAEIAPNHYDSDNVFCSLPDGYWGRDHGDDDGIPPDGQLRTAYGVYPVGGRFDDNSFQVIASISLGARGAGITPLILASWVDMMRAEMALVEGDATEARQFLQAGVEKSFEKVRLFGQRDANADLSTAPDPALDDAYVQELGQVFDGAADDDERMDILGAEYFVTLFGNGLDGFNFYRRTGRPSFLQPNLEPSPGDFFRSFFYPPVFVERNSSIQQKSGVTDMVFWDTGVPLLAN